MRSGQDSEAAMMLTAITGYEAEQPLRFRFKYGGLVYGLGTFLV